MKGSLSSVGLDTTQFENGLNERVGRKRTRTTRDDDMDIDGDSMQMKKKMNRSQSHIRNPSMRDRSVMGLRNAKEIQIADDLKNKHQRLPNLNARASESDRRNTVAKPKHLFAGKRGAGKTDRR